MHLMHLDMTNKMQFYEVYCLEDIFTHTFMTNMHYKYRLLLSDCKTCCKLFFTHAVISCWLLYVMYVLCSVE